MRFAWIPSRATPITPPAQSTTATLPDPRGAAHEDHGRKRSRLPEGGVSPILVTGASGFLGAHLVRSLLRQGFDVVSVSRQSHQEDKRHLRLDLRDAAAIQKIFRQFPFRSVVHLAAAGVAAEGENLEDLAAVTTLAAAALGRIALAHSVERFVHVGSALEYKPQARAMDETTPLGAPNPYGVS